MFYSKRSMPGAANRLSPGLKKISLMGLSFLSITLSASVYAGPVEQAKRIHERLTGTLPSASVLSAMEDELQAGRGVEAANIAMNSDYFYRTTIKNWAAPWTNRDQDVFVDLNDYIATVMGYVNDERDFREILYGDELYTFGNNVATAYSPQNNTHYEEAENTSVSDLSFSNALTPVAQNALPGAVLSDVNAAAGVMTSRAAAQAFFIDGTNRAMLRFTLLNHMCMDLEQLQDASLPPDRVRQDVSRSPGGDSRVFVNTCVSCHSGMDPLAQAFAHYDYDFVDPNNNGEGAPMTMVYTADQVNAKYHINENTFPFGFVTPDDSWDNYWREGVNSYIQWPSTSNDAGGVPGTGNGAKSLGYELAHTDKFAQCQVDKVFKSVCLRDPINSADRTFTGGQVTGFNANGNIKSVFANTADYCKGE